MTRQYDALPVVQRGEQPRVRAVHRRHEHRHHAGPDHHPPPPAITQPVRAGDLQHLRVLVDLVPLHHRATQQRRGSRDGRPAPPTRPLADHVQPQVQPGLDVPVVRGDTHREPVPRRGVQGDR